MIVLIYIALTVSSIISCFSYCKYFLKMIDSRLDKIDNIIDKRKNN